MNKIVMVSSENELTMLREALKNARSLRVSINGDQVKFKVNGGMWSAPMGYIDPSSDYACEQRRKYVDDHGIERDWNEDAAMRTSKGDL